MKQSGVLEDQMVIIGNVPDVKLGDDDCDNMFSYDIDPIKFSQSSLGCIKIINW